MENQNQSEVNPNQNQNAQPEQSLNLDKAKELLQKEGYITASESDFKSLIDERHKEATREIYSNVDNTFKQFGIERPNDKKTTEFLSEWLQNAQKTQESLQAEIEKYKSSSNVGEELRKELTEKEQLFQSKLTEYEQRLQEREREFETYQVKSKIEAEIGALKFREDLPQSVIDTMRSAAIQKVMNTPSEIRDGKRVYLDSDGKAMRNSKTTEPLTERDLLSEALKDVLSVDRNIKSVDVSVNEKPVISDGVVQVPKSVTSRRQLDEYLRSLKLDGKTITKTMLANAHLPF